MTTNSIYKAFINALLADASYVTLPAKNVSLTEWNNSDKEKANDEDIKGTVHARI